MQQSEAATAAKTPAFAQCEEGFADFIFVFLRDLVVFYALKLRLSATEFGRSIKLKKAFKNGCALGARVL